MRRAYRRPVTDADLQGPLEFYRKARADGDFDAGIEMALSAVLVSPEFLFRVEQDPAGVAAEHAPIASAIWSWRRGCRSSCGAAFRTTSCSTWPSRGKLHEPAVLEQQVRRMLADARSRALVTNFAVAVAVPAQPRLDHAGHAAVPGLRRQPAAGLPRRRRSCSSRASCARIAACSTCCSANYTFLNERLAKHYGIPHVYGSRFRRVTLDDDSWRGGLLRQGSILTVTSYATRTSPVLRGKWVLENLLGVAAAAAAARRAGAEGQHGRRQASRCASGWPSTASNPACAGCHKLMDPVGLSLENFDAVGRWRTVEDGTPIDASGGLPDGSKFDGVAGLEAGAAAAGRSCSSARLTEKLLTYALGRGVEYYDAPAVRAIVRDAQAAGLPLLVDHPGHREQHAVSDEEVAMIITKKALPRRTFLRGMGATVALPLLDAMVPSMTALAQTPANPVRRLGFVYMPMGCDIAAVDAARRGHARRAVADAAVAGAGRRISSR